MPQLNAKILLVVGILPRHPILVEVTYERFIINFYLLLFIIIIIFSIILLLN